MKITDQNKHILNNNNPIVCVYHDPCQDGISSAWVVYKALVGREIQFVPDSYNQGRAEFALTPENLKDKHLIIADYSYPSERIVELSKIAKTLTILDHHTKSRDDIEPLLEKDLIKGVFDMSKSGCLITWDFFFKEDAPQFLKHISDRDLYNFKLEGSKEIYYACLSKNYEVAEWNQMINQCSVEMLIEIGKPILAKYMEEIENIASTKKIVSICGYSVPIVEVPDEGYGSDTCAFLYEQEDVPFAVAYIEKDGITKVSFRSKKGVGMNVNEIAKVFGGGGHIHASGVRVKSLSEIID
ncbi:DHHA1 domain-containing protein [Photobacterium damselae]|uniref:DHHA1 domain-containing protein n=1 Tax=Photobacterium damselae TaxID=38293 RepID=UPI001EEE88B0|nr:DHHA1 domain-containing protein [Photobacterium damselae]UKA04677.1 DHHA1 domain-containing protein [Photobacterium damselae subsp. damselae]